MYSYKEDKVLMAVLQVLVERRRPRDYKRSPIQILGSIKKNNSDYSTDIVRIALTKKRM